MSVIDILERAASVLANTPMEPFEFPGPIEATISGTTHGDLMKRIGLPDKNFESMISLDSGEQGTVYSMGDGARVLKVTRDATEANSSIKLVGKKAKTIATIFDVFGMRTGRMSATSKWVKLSKSIYGILQEELETPDRDWGLLGTAWYNFRSDEDEAGGYSEESLNRHFETPINAKNVQRFAEWVESHNVDGLPGNWLPWLQLVASELKAAGIVFRDLHPGNIMKRQNGDHVLIDLGVSRSARSVIPMLARAR